MPDKKGNKVEKYKLTEDQVEFAKNYKKLEKIREILSEVSLAEQARASNLRELWNRLIFSYAALEKQAPGDELRNLEGMNFPTQYEGAEGMEGAGAGGGAGRVPKTQVSPNEAMDIFRQKPKINY